MLNDAAIVILAAGQGTRMKSRMAKVLHRAGGKPLVRQAIDTALEIAPAERVFVVVGYQAAEVRAEVEAAGAHASIRPTIRHRARRYVRRGSVGEAGRAVDRVCRRLSSDPRGNAQRSGGNAAPQPRGRRCNYD